MADLSKVSVLGNLYNLKDAKSRQDLTTLLGGHALEALKSAAWHDVAAAISDGDGKIADAATVKAYVDAQIGTIHKFDVVVADVLPTASADTMYKLYLIPKAGSEEGNIKEEWITVRSGAEGSYTYAWEKIGDTEIDLSGYVQKTQKIAEIDLQDDITVEELQEALGLEDLAYANTASGSTTLETIDTITMKAVTVAGNATVTSADAAADLEMGDYTPAGTITGSAISGGSINVTLKDQATKTEADLTTSTFTPAGTVAAVDGGSFSALKSATFQVAGSEGGVQIAGTVSAPNINLTSAEKTFATGLTGGKVASFSEGQFHAASISEGFFSAGSLPTKAADTFDGGSFDKKTAVSAAIEGVVASVGSGADAETLILTAAQTDEVMDHDATFTAATFSEGAFSQGTLPSIDTTKFDGGSKDADVFEANELQGVATDKVNNVTAAALANAPVFTGSKYSVVTTDDTALKTVAFTATNSATIVDKVEYVKQDVDTKTFTPVAATLGFSGTTAEDVLVTGVTYKKADATAAFSETVTPEVNALNKTAKTVKITVTPDAE